MSHQRFEFSSEMLLLCLKEKLWVTSKGVMYKVSTFSSQDLNMIRRLILNGHAPTMHPWLTMIEQELVLRG